MTSEFGRSPYRASYYGEKRPLTPNWEVNSSDNDADVLCGLLEMFKRGFFSEVKRLVPFLSHSSYDLRQYGHQLFAHVCNHEQVVLFESAFPAIASSEELHRLAIRLGETLSPDAIPLLQTLYDVYCDNSEDVEHVLLALRLMCSPHAISDSSPDKDDVSRLLVATASSIMKPNYYYHGRPVFIGDITKELVAASLLANEKRSKVVLVRQTQLLSNFSGIECPIRHGQYVTDEDMNAVFDYVEKLARNRWEQGHKYFYGHII